MRWSQELKTSTFFDAVADTYDRDLARSLADVRSRLVGLIPAGSRVLDLGIGTGRELVVLDELGCSVTGIDSSPKMLARAAERRRATHLISGDLWAPWDVGDGTFDAVIALHASLAHPADASEERLENLARECARVLKAGGLLYFELPTEEAFRSSRSGHRVVMRPHGERSAECTDVRSGATLLATCWPEASWRAAFEPWFAVGIALTRDEMRISATLASR